MFDGWQITATKGLTFLLVLAVSYVSASSAVELPFQGANAEWQNGSYVNAGNLTVRVYTDSGCSALLWQESYNTSPIVNGSWALTLGNNSSNALNFNYGTSYYMKVWIGENSSGDAELQSWSLTYGGTTTCAKIATSLGEVNMSGYLNTTGGYNRSEIEALSNLTYYYNKSVSYNRSQIEALTNLTYYTNTTDIYTRTQVEALQNLTYYLNTGAIGTLTTLINGTISNLTGNVTQLEISNISVHDNITQLRNSNASIWSNITQLGISNISLTDNITQIRASNSSIYYFLSTISGNATALSGNKSVTGTCGAGDFVTAISASTFTCGTPGTDLTGYYTQAQTEALSNLTYYIAAINTYTRTQIEALANLSNYMTTSAIATLSSSMNLTLSNTNTSIWGNITQLEISNISTQDNITQLRNSNASIWANITQLDISNISTIDNITQLRASNATIFYAKATIEGNLTTLSGNKSATGNCEAGQYVIGLSSSAVSCDTVTPDMTGYYTQAQVEALQNLTYYTTSVNTYTRAQVEALANLSNYLTSADTYTRAQTEGLQNLTYYLTSANTYSRTQTEALSNLTNYLASSNTYTRAQIEALANLSSYLTSANTYTRTQTEALKNITEAVALSGNKSATGNCEAGQYVIGLSASALSCDVPVADMTGYYTQAQVEALANLTNYLTSANTYNRAQTEALQNLTYYLTSANTYTRAQIEALSNLTNYMTTTAIASLSTATNDSITGSNNSIWANITQLEISNISTIDNITQIRATNASIFYKIATVSGNASALSGNKSGIGNCEAGQYVTGVTATVPTCDTPTADMTGYYTQAEVEALDNLTNYMTTTQVTALSTSTNYTAATISGNASALAGNKSGIGDCAAGTWIQNLTTGAPECATPTADMTGYYTQAQVEALANLTNYKTSATVDSLSTAMNNSLSGSNSSLWGAIGNLSYSNETGWGNISSLIGSVNNLSYSNQTAWGNISSLIGSVNNLSYSNVTAWGNITALSGNKSGVADCAAGTWVQNLTTGNPECAAPTADMTGYYTQAQTEALSNLTNYLTSAGIGTLSTQTNGTITNRTANITELEISNISITGNITQLRASNTSIYYKIATIEGNASTLSGNKSATGNCEAGQYVIGLSSSAVSCDTVTPDMTGYYTQAQVEALQNLTYYMTTSAIASLSTATNNSITGSNNTLWANITQLEISNISTIDNITQLRGSNATIWSNITALSVSNISITGNITQLRASNTSIYYSLSTISGNATALSGNKSTTGNCAAGQWVQNLTAAALQCAVPVADMTGYYTQSSVEALANLTYYTVSTSMYTRAQTEALANLTYYTATTGLYTRAQTEALANLTYYTTSANIYTRTQTEALANLTNYITGTNTINYLSNYAKINTTNSFNANQTINSTYWIQYSNSTSKVGTYFNGTCMVIQGVTSRLGIC